MVRITNQYVWNFVFFALFALLLVVATLILETQSRFLESSLKPIDYILMILATWRLVRLFVYDTVSKFLREQFWDIKEDAGGYELVKPKKGLRRTLADLFSCPACVSVWAGLVVVFFYLLTPYAVIPALVLSISVVAYSLQNLGTMVAAVAKYLTRRQKNNR